MKTYMDLKDVVQETINVKKYWADKILLELVEEIIDSGRYATCAGTTVSWKVIVITDDKLKDKISTCCMDQNWIGKAPVVLVVCSDATSFKKFYGKKGEDVYAIQNTIAAAENMRITATSLGISSCWISFFEEKSLKRVLKIPEKIKPEVVITLGYSDMKTERPSRTGLDRLVYFNEWGNYQLPHNVWPLSEPMGKLSKEIEKGVKRIKEF